MAGLEYTAWIAVFVISLSLAEKRFLLDTYMDITTSYEEWSAWGACTASCGVMGTQQRTRGCNHTCFLLGMMKFSNQCPIFGIESQVCSGACTQTAASVTLTYPGSWSHWGQFSSCDKSCGGGIQIRRRVCGAGTCRGDSLESASCNNHQCPVKSSTLFPTTRISASTPPPPPTTTTTTLKPTTINHALYITIKRREENKQ
uniref:Thrombospondin-2-like n=1 Tax=Crassostrea virginica TaxID=6565 RepID=A0A8B8DUN8_CRAVI|nr:thrombospondin-2-like [Crassostrea virginica]